MTRIVTLIFTIVIVIVAYKIYSSIGHNDDEGTPVSYQATVAQPGGTLAFHWLSQLKEYEQNNTPLTQQDAIAMASYGKSIPQGTVVTVVAETDFPGVNELSNDTHLCEVQPQGSDERLWIQCWYLRKGEFIANRAIQPERLPKIAGFPSLGDDKSTISSKLASNNSDDPSDVLKNVYYIPIAGQNIRLWINYFVDGKVERAGLFTLRVAFGSINSNVEKEIVSKVLPSDSYQIPASEAGSGAADDATGLAATESTVFFESKKLAEKVATSQYMKPGGVLVAGPCPYARPGIIEVYRSHDDKGALNELIFTAGYVYHCQRGAV